MNSQDKKQFLDAMMAMGELYNREISPALTMMYFDDLSGFSIDAVLSALRSHRKDPDRGRYFPKPSDIIEKLSGGTREHAVLAWAEVTQLVRNSRAAKSQNEITEAVVAQLGGWLRLGQTDYAQFEWLQKEFIERYQAVAKRYEQARDPIAALNRSTFTLISGDK